MLYKHNTKQIYNAPIFSVHNFYIGHDQILGSMHHYLVRISFFFMHQYSTQITTFLCITPTFTANPLAPNTQCTSPILLNTVPIFHVHSLYTNTMHVPLIILHAMLIFNAHSLRITNIQCAHPTHYYYAHTHQLCMASIFIVHVFHSHITCAPPVLYPIVPIFTTHPPRTDIFHAP
jgi:hypothetical protein